MLSRILAIGIPAGLQFITYDLSNIITQSSINSFGDVTTAAWTAYAKTDAIIWMILGSEAVRLAPAEKRGAANATFYFAFDAAIGLGAAFWGAMIDGVGYNTCYTIAAIAGAVLLVACVPVFKGRKA